MDFRISRRQFIKGAAAAGVGMALPLKFAVKDVHAFYQSPGLQKFIQPLHGVHNVPPEAISVAIPDLTPAPVTGVTHYTITLQQFQNTLHPNMGGPTTLWGYVPTRAIHALPNGNPGTPLPVHLGGVIIAQKGVPVQITFRNQLPAKSIIPVDATIPGANQAQNRSAVHLHGGFIPWISDGGPFDWWGPNGTHGLSFQNNILNPGAAANEAEYYYTNDQSARLMWYHDHAFGITRTNAYAGLATGYVLRDVFEAGLISLGLPNFIENNGNEIPIIVQDKIFVDAANINLLDPTWAPKGLPSTTGSLWYPHIYERSRWALVGAGRNLPNPSVIAEMFGDTMLANGVVFPEAAVEPRRYRLRILNACNARFLNLQLYVDNGSPDGISFDTAFNPTNVKGPDFLVLGMEGGFLKNPVVVPSNTPFGIPTTTIPPLGFFGSLITGPAERWDVMVDFSGNAPDGLPYAGRNVILYTDAPAPFPGGDPRNDYFPGAPGNPTQPNPGFGPNTRQIMRFAVGTTVTLPADAPLAITPATDLTPGIDPFLADPTQYVNPNNPALGTVPYQVHAGITLGNGGQPRRLTLNEAFDAYGRLTQKVGTTSPVSPGRFGLAYLDNATETPGPGDVEIWEIYNLTGDTHPMHIHLVNAQILQRAQFDALTPIFAPIAGTERPPDPVELGWKETFKMNPGEVITLIMKFKLPPVPFNVPASLRTGGNEYVWHCHILEHEEHDMMRPLVVSGTPPTFAVTPEREAVVSSAGGTVTFTVFGGTAPYTITPGVGAPAPNTLQVANSMGAFTVTVGAGYLAGTYTYGIADSTTNTTTATLVVAPL